MIFPEEQTYPFSCSLQLDQLNVIRLVKWNKFIFSSIEINKPLPTPVHRVFVGQIQVQQPSPVVTADQMPDTFRVESSFISIDIKYSIRKVMYSRKSIGTRMEPWRGPALIGYSCEDFPSRTSWTHLLLRKDEIRSTIWPKIS